MAVMSQDQKDERINEIHSKLLKIFNDIEICIDELKSLGNHSRDEDNALLNTRDWLQQLSKRYNPGGTMGDQWNILAANVCNDILNTIDPNSIKDLLKNTPSGELDEKELKSALALIYKRNAKTLNGESHKD